MWTIAYEPKAIFLCPIFTFGLPYTIVDGIKFLDTPPLNGNLFSKSTTPSIGYLLIILVYLCNGFVRRITLAHSLILHIYFSIIPTCSLFAYICIKPGSNYVHNVLMLKFLSPWSSVILKPLVSYFFLSSDFMNGVVTFDVSNFSERKNVFPVLLCSNIKPFKYKMSMYRCRVLCLYGIGRDNGVFRFLNALLVSSSWFYPVEWVLLPHTCLQLCLWNTQLCYILVEGCC